MKLQNEFDPVRNWADAKGIYSKGDVKTQLLKLIEESGELSKAILKKDKGEFIDAVGDCCIVLVSIAELGNSYFEEDSDITIEKCINSAYEIISERTGKMENGTFVKNKPD